MTVETPTAPVTAVATRDEPGLTPFEVIERVISSGDLSSMSAPDRVAFYWRTCESLGLNPLTRPFDFIKGDNGQIIMYAKKDATDQLRKIHHVNVTALRRENDAELGVLSVFARGRDATGREDESVGAVFVSGLGGQTLANAIMKAETKAKRRLTLSLVGLGFLDETEIDGIGARLDVDPDTGEIREAPAKPLSLIESVRAQQEALAADVEPAASEEALADAPVEAQPAAGGTDQRPATAEPSQDDPGPEPDARCGNPSPYGDGGACGLPATHKGRHRMLGDAGKVVGSWEST